MCGGVRAGAEVLVLVVARRGYLLSCRYGMMDDDGKIKVGTAKSLNMVPIYELRRFWFPASRFFSP